MERILVVAVVAAAVLATAASARSAVIEAEGTPTAVTVRQATCEVATSPEAMAGCGASVGDAIAWKPAFGDMLLGSAAVRQDRPSASPPGVTSVYFAGGGLVGAEGMQALSM